jgi:putative membrane protein
MAALTALAVGSCADQHAEVANCADFVMSPSQYTAQIRGRIGAEDNDELAFICHAATYGRAQILYARLAEERAADPAVRGFAARTLESQTRLSRRLNHVAVQHEGLTPPPGLEPAQLAARDRLAQLSGDGFDRAYLQVSAEEGSAAVALFREGCTLVAPFVSQFAGAALPELERRTSAAQSLLRQGG